MVCTRRSQAVHKISVEHIGVYTRRRLNTVDEIMMNADADTENLLIGTNLQFMYTYGC